MTPIASTGRPISRLTGYVHDGTAYLNADKLIAILLREGYRDLADRLERAAANIVEQAK